MSKAANDARLWRSIPPGWHAPHAADGGHAASSVVACMPGASRRRSGAMQEAGASPSELEPNAPAWSGPTLPATGPIGAAGPRFAPLLDQPLLFSKYRLLARLGSGGMADVFLAVSGSGAGSVHKLLVLKVLRPDLPDAERVDFVRMFQDEGRLAVRLSHAAIVQAYEVGSEGAFSFIAMEYLEGQPLSAVQERSWTSPAGISTEQQLHVLCQVLDGLEYAHGLTDYDGRPLNIVHRDVSPQNVFVTYSGHAKLVDFGIAKTLDSNSKTAAGVVKGKIRYMSPEQVRCDPVDFRADLFSVGVMAWEAAAGRSLHGQSSLYETLQRLVSGDLPRLRDVVPDMDLHLDAIVSRALSRDPDHRHESAAALRDDLSSFLESRPKVSSRALGERVRGLFEPERQAVSAVIRHALGSSKAAAVEPVLTRTAPPLAVAARTDDTDSGGRMRITAPVTAPSLQALPWSGNAKPSQVDTAGAMSDASGSFPTGLAASASATPARASRRRVVVWAGGLALVGLGALFFSSRGPVTPSPIPPTTDLNPMPPPLEQRPTVRISLTARPETAVFTLDGLLLQGNPYRGERLLDSDLHTLSVSAEGHEPQQRELELSSDVALEVRLRPIEEASPPGGAAPPTTEAALPPDGVARPPRSGPVAPPNPKPRPPEDLSRAPLATDPIHADPPQVPSREDDLYPDSRASNRRAARRLKKRETPW